MLFVIKSYTGLFPSARANVIVLISFLKNPFNGVYAVALAVFERKVLRKIFGSVRVGDDYRIRINRKLYELFNDFDVGKRNSNQRLRWLGHVVQIDEDSPSRRVFDAMVGCHQRVERPGKR